MAILRNGNVKKYTFLHNGKKLKKAFHNGSTVLWTAGSTVTYHVDTNVVYTEDVDSGASCLSPTSFTPTKSGWIFIGWREDATASGTVLTSKVMDDSPITLYAVFKQSVTVTYYNVSDATKRTSAGTKHYNNCNIANPRFTLAPTGYGPEWTFRGWTTGTAANASVTYANLSNTEIASNVTLYILLQQTITLKTMVSGATSSHTGILYLNSYGANTVLVPTFTVANPAKSDFTFRGWSNSASNTTIVYSSINNLSLSTNTTLYAVFEVNTKYLFSANNNAGGFAKYAGGIHNELLSNGSDLVVGETLWFRVSAGGQNVALNSIISSQQNLSNYSKIIISYHITAENSSVYDSASIFATSAKGTLMTPAVENTFYFANSAGSGVSGTAELDISNLSGNYYIGIQLKSNNATTTISINQIYMQ